MSSARLPRSRRASRLFLAIALLSTSAARAQPPEPAPAPNPAPDPTPAPSLARARVDVELSDSGELRQGALALTPRDFFQLAGRADLVERSDRKLLERRWLLGSAGAVLLASVVVGSIILALTPNIEKPYCLSTRARFSECSDYILLYERGGVSTLIGGAAVATFLGTLGWWANPDLFAWRELAPLVDGYNARPVP